MGTHENEHHQTIRASDIVGTHVENWDGENLGVISEVMVNKYHGEIAYYVLSYPGEYGILYPNKRFAVPFEALARKLNGAEVEYILNVDEAFLRKAPGLDNTDWPDFADPKFNSVLKDYYKDVSLDIRA